MFGWFRAKRDAGDSDDARTTEQRYERRATVAGGGQSIVYRVFDRIMKREVAMKLMRPEVAARPQGRRRFEREAHSTGRLDHPNVLPVHDFGEDAQGLPWFTMKIVEGDTLEELIHRRDESLTAAARLGALLEVLLKVCDALAFAHSRDVIHRDIKPENIMVGTHGQVYLMDWGVARELGDSEPAGAESWPAPPSTLDGAVVGTPQYLSPEQAHGKIDEVDARSDVFALGAVLYEMLTGRPPYLGEELRDMLLRAQKGDYPAPLSIAPDAPRGLCRIATKAMSLAPEARYPSVEAFRADIESFARGSWRYETRDFPAGEVIVREGDPGGSAYILLEGRCEIFRTVDGEERPIREIGAGETFGELSVITHQVRSATVRAVGPVRTKVVDADTFEEWLGLDAWIASFVRVLGKRFREGSEQLDVAQRGGEVHQVLWVAAEQAALHGDAIPEGGRGLGWQALCAEVQSRTGLAPERIEAILDGAEGWSLDVEGDRLILHPR